MAIFELNTIKAWFTKGKIPTQEQFWNTWDSFHHKRDKIAQDSIEGLSGALAGKVDAPFLEAHKTDPEAHADIREALEQEAAERQSTDESLAETLAQELISRSTADSALQTAINTLKAAINVYTGDETPSIKVDVSEDNKISARILFGGNGTADTAARSDHSHTPESLGAAPSSHKHTKTDITDFAHNHTASDLPAYPTLGSLGAVASNDARLNGYVFGGYFCGYFNNYHSSNGNLYVIDDGYDLHIDTSLRDMMRENQCVTFLQMPGLGLSFDLSDVGIFAPKATYDTLNSGVREVSVLRVQDMLICTVSEPLEQLR